MVPWKEFGALIEPFCPMNEGAVCLVVGLERMLRIGFLPPWFNLSDPAIVRLPARRAFAGIDLGCEGTPDETAGRRNHFSMGLGPGAARPLAASGGAFHRVIAIGLLLANMDRLAWGYGALLVFPV